MWDLLFPSSSFGTAITLMFFSGDLISAGSFNSWFQFNKLPFSDLIMSFGL
jgi:hypothetical protein